MTAETNKYTNTDIQKNGRLWAQGGTGGWADEQLHFEMRTHFICFAAGILGSPPLSPHCKHNSKWQLKVGKVKNRTPEVRWLHVIVVEGWRGGIISIPLSLSDSLGNHRWITQN